jgi:hypothetical protein
MGQINSDFPQLPDIDDPQRIAVYSAVYAQLAAMGLPTPGPSPAQISRAQLLNHLQKEAGKLVKEELKKTTNPDYSGKTDEEQAALVNDYHQEHGNAPPVNYVLLSFPFAPNLLTLADVKGSKQNGK